MTSKIIACGTIKNSKIWLRIVVKYQMQNIPSYNAFPGLKTRESSRVAVRSYLTISIFNNRKFREFRIAVVKK